MIDCRVLSCQMTGVYILVGSTEMKDLGGELIVGGEKRRSRGFHVDS